MRSRVIVYVGSPVSQKTLVPKQRTPFNRRVDSSRYFSPQHVALPSLPNIVLPSWYCIIRSVLWRIT